MSQITMVQQFVNAEDAQTDAAAAMSAFFARFVGWLATFVTAEAWEEAGRAFGTDYNSLRKYEANAPAGKKAWERLTKQAQNDCGIKKPQSDEAKELQAKRKAKAENVSLALLTSDAVPLADRIAEVERLEKAAKSTDATRAAEAQAILANVGEFAQKVKQDDRKLKELRDACHAFALVERLAGPLSKVQKKAWDAAKAAIATL